MLVELGKANTMVKNRYGLIPIMAAAERCQTSVFDYLFSQCSDVLTKEEEIDSLELLGASFANDKDNNNIEKCYEYLELAMKLRWQNTENPIQKKGLQVRIFFVKSYTFTRLFHVFFIFRSLMPMTVIKNPKHLRN